MFSCTKEKKKYKTFRPFGLNSDHWSVGHPALTPDGKILYFVSDMDGGYGGTDIWYCTMTDEGWSLAVNAGPMINTPGNEMFPFIALNGDLYFSSTGQPGFGGLDLFVCHKEGNLWKTPVNLGAPVNSPYDDFSIQFNSIDSTGFFSSSRPGGVGSDDIYYMKQLPPKVFLIACVKDKATGEPLPGSSIAVSNSASKEVLSFVADAEGCFRMQIRKGIAYSVKAEFPGYHPGLLEVKFTNDSEAKNFTTPKIIELERIIVPPPPPPPSPPPVVPSVYFDFDRSDIRADAKPILDNLVQVMKEGNFMVEINAFCDSRGSNAYNDALSKRRAESVIQYLVSKGIDRNRMVASGNGETRLVNKCTDHVPCTKAEHQANRRAEFKLIPGPGPATTLSHR
jgi:outer membrane protein OmpA-like peptidoglycan-associated protein